MGRYSCIIESNETVYNISAFDLKGDHENRYSDYDVYYIAIKEVNITDFPKYLFDRFLNVERFACVNTSLKHLKYEYFKNALKLGTLWADDNQIDSIERDFLKDTNRPFEKLYLRNNKITDLSSNAFGNLSMLTDLYIDNNLLKIIRNNTFMGLPKLSNLELLENLIEFFEPDAFKGLMALKYLSLSNNKIEQLDKNIFKPLSTLEALSLNNNFLSYLDFDLFENLESLTHLNVRNNRFKFISVTQSKYLIRLDISLNQIDAIEKFDIELLSQFQELIATGNLCVNRNFKYNLNTTQALNECFTNYRIPKCNYYTDKIYGVTCEATNYFDVDDDLPINVTHADIHFLKIRNFKEQFSFGMLTKSFRNLNRISIHNTNMQHVLEQNFECKEMKIIDIRINDLIQTRGNIFAECSKLEELILIHNNIHSLPEGFFNGLWNIKLMDLSFNKLMNEDLNRINYNFSKIKKLYLSENKFTEIPNESFKFMAGLQILKLNGNKIVKIDENAFESLINLKQLHLQHNGIMDLIFLGPLSKLTYLNFEGNKLKEINSTLPHKLQYIDASFNQIENINLSMIVGLKNLNDFLLTNNVCCTEQINDIKFLSKNITLLLQSCNNY